MTVDELREELKNAKVRSHYLFMASEWILVENGLRYLRQALRVDEAFDCETIAADEVPLEEIIPKLYLAPFASARRLLIVKNVDQLTAQDGKRLAAVLGSTSGSNCIALCCMIAASGRDAAREIASLAKLYPFAAPVVDTVGRDTVRKWIFNKMRKSGVRLPRAVADYLADEFQNDVTGLKHEWDKIENYLSQIGSLDEGALKELTQGLCDGDKYGVARLVAVRDNSALARFEEVKPYLKSHAELVDALTRVLMSRVPSGEPPGGQRCFERLSDIDHSVKSGTTFGDLRIELFIAGVLGLVEGRRTHGR